LSVESEGRRRVVEGRGVAEEGMEGKRKDRASAEAERERERKERRMMVRKESTLPRKRSNPSASR
jgi:hypothetical protein